MEFNTVMNEMKGGRLAKLGEESFRMVCLKTFHGDKLEGTIWEMQSLDFDQDWVRVDELALDDILSLEWEL